MKAVDHHDVRRRNGGADDDDDAVTAVRSPCRTLVNHCGMSMEPMAAVSSRRPGDPREEHRRRMLAVGETARRWPTVHLRT